jgi:hypothetical protein
MKYKHSGSIDLFFHHSLRMKRSNCRQHFDFIMVILRSTVSSPWNKVCNVIPRPLNWKRQSSVVICWCHILPWSRSRKSLCLYNMARYEFRPEIIGILAVLIGVDFLIHPSPQTSYICRILRMFYVYLGQKFIYFVLDGIVIRLC